MGCGPVREKRISIKRDLEEVRTIVEVGSVGGFVPCREERGCERGGLHRKVRTGQT